MFPWQISRTVSGNWPEAYLGNLTTLIYGESPESTRQPRH